MSAKSTMGLNRRQILLSTAGAAPLLFSPVPVQAVETSSGPAFGRAQPFDLGWRFQRGDGEAFETAGFDESSWRIVDLPHDWSVEDLPRQSGEPETDIVGPFAKKAEGGTATGFTVGGDGWYRKRFDLKIPPGGRVEVLFEGVYMNSDVWINGTHLGNHPNGYTPFSYDLTPYLSPAGTNVIAVRVRNHGRNSRWYSGSGIYRHVWLDVLPEQTRIARWGVCVVTQRITDKGADIAIDTRVEGAGPEHTLLSRIRDRAGRSIWEASMPAQPRTQKTMTIAAPELWSPDAPTLYMLETELHHGSTVIDRIATPFGVRIISFDVSEGMKLNGTPTKLRGGCIHHDHGLLGAAAFDAAEDRKVKILKARGFNAVRPSHNLFSAAFLGACDRHGLMVIEETFDVWREPKLPQDYAVYFDDQWRADLEAIVLSTRNHPSIIMWSIGNEIPERNLPAGIETQWELANEVHTLDPSRPVTAAINDFAGRPVVPSEKTAPSGRAGVPDQTSMVFLDVAGYNYKLSQYEGDHARYPSRIIFGTESFPKDVFAIWDITEKSSYLLGDFVWTAMDYLGEAGIGGSAYAPPNTPALMASFAAWPCVVSDCGDIDLLGNQKGASFARDVVWGLSPLEIAIQKPPPEGKVEVVRPWGWSDERQSWTWPGLEGKTLAVRVYTSGDRVELRLNGRTLDSRAVTPADLKHIVFNVAYTPGTLEAVAFRDGHQIARRELTTAGEPVAIRLRSELPIAGARRGDVSYIGVEIVDARGRRVPDTVKDLQLSISGPAELAGFGSANPFAVGSFQSASAKTWDGRALAILRGEGRAGRVKITVRTQGLKPASLSLRFA